MVSATEPALQLPSLLLVLFVYFFLSSPGYLIVILVDQTGPRLRDPPASAASVLG